MPLKTTPHGGGSQAAGGALRDMPKRAPPTHGDKHHRSDGRCRVRRRCPLRDSESQAVNIVSGSQLVHAQV